MLLLEVSDAGIGRTLRSSHKGRIVQTLTEQRSSVAIASIQGRGYGTACSVISEQRNREGRERCVEIDVGEGTLFMGKRKKSLKNKILKAAYLFRVSQFVLRLRSDHQRTIFTCRHSYLCLRSPRSQSEGKMRY